MTPAQFAQWRETMNLRKGEAAALFGVTTRTITNYEKGVNPVPRSIDLACMAFASGLKGWSEYPR